MGTTANLEIPTVEQSQNQKEVTLAAAMHRIDVMVFPKAASQGDTAPPGSPANGDVYIVGAAPTGAWTGKTKNIAYYVNGWLFIAPKEGMLVWVDDENAFYIYNGGAWGAFGATGTFTLLGINATADATNKLAVASAAVLFNNAGAGMQHKINKNAAGDSASVLFQTGASGRAEFGTTGDDDFHMKVSHDGATWYDGLLIKKQYGRVLKKSVNATVAAAGTTQGAATQLTHETSNISSATGGSADGVKLWTAEGGDEAFIVNASAATVKIYPATGAQINALGTNNPLSLTAGQRAIIKSITSTQWYSIVQ